MSLRNPDFFLLWVMISLVIFAYCLNPELLYGSYQLLYTEHNFFRGDKFPGINAATKCSPPVLSSRTVLDGSRVKASRTKI